MKKIILLFLALLMLVLPLASCNNGKGNETSTKSDETEEYVEEYYLNTLPKTNYSYSDIKIACIDTNMAPTELTDMSTPVEQKSFERVAALEEYFDVEVVYYQITGDDSAEISQLTLLASGQGTDVVDIFISQPDHLMNLAINGYNTNLNSVDNLALENVWWSQSMNKNLAFNGALYATAGPVSEFYYTASVALAYNKDMAEDFGLPDLYDLVLSGNWTLEEMQKICTDYGVNNPDEEGRYAISFATGVAPYAPFVSAGGQFATINESNEIIVDLDSDRHIDILGKILLAFDATKTFGNTVAETQKKFTDNQALFWCATTGYFKELPATGLDYGIIPCPKYDATQKEYITCAWPTSNYAVAIPTCIGGDRLEWTGLFLEAYCFLGYDMIKPVQYDSLLKYQVATDPESSQILDLLFNGMYFDINLVANFGDSRKLVANAISSGTLGRYTSLCAQFEPAIQGDISKFDALTKGN